MIVIDGRTYAGKRVKLAWVKIILYKICDQFLVVVVDRSDLPPKGKGRVA